MAITKETQIGKIEVVGKYKSVQVRTDTVVMEDSKELSRQYHRHVLNPDADISNESDEIKRLADTLWTDAIKKAWDDKVKADAGI